MPHFRPDHGSSQVTETCVGAEGMVDILLTTFAKVKMFVCMDLMAMITNM